MKLGVFALVGIFVVVVVLLFFQFCYKYRKRNGEVIEQNAYPMHELGASVSSSGKHSLDLSKHSYTYNHLTDTMKREMLQDPLVTDESKEKVKKELAENEKLLKNSARVSVPTLKINSDVPVPLLPPNEVSDVIGVCASSSSTHSLDISEHRYYDFHLTDNMKRKMLQDPFVTAESKEKAKKELAENEKLLKNYARVSVPTFKINSDVPVPLLPPNEVTDELEVSASFSGAHSLDVSEHRYYAIQSTDTMKKKKMLQDSLVTAQSKEKVEKELAESENFLQNSEGVSVPTFKMNSDAPAPLLPPNEVTDELTVSASSSGERLLDMSEHRYYDIHSTDTVKREMLQDPLVTAESKEKVEKELTENKKLLNSGVLCPLNEVTDEIGVSASSSGAHSLDMSEHRYCDIQLTDIVKREMLQNPLVTAKSKEKVKKELAESEKLLQNSARVSVAQNEEEGKLLGETEKLLERQ